jgi:SAM-dependent methyltransferase
VSLLVPARRPSRELLDDPSTPAEEMVRSLRDIDYVNRRWGGSRVIERHLAARGDAGAGELAVLDVGAGSGAFARRLAAGLSAGGRPARVVALDLQWRHLAAGLRGSGKSAAVAGDAFSLPFAEGAFDWVVSTLFFHHFSPEENIRLLRSLAAASRGGFAVLDLARHLVPLAFVAVAGRLLFESRLSVHDGKASVRQAYTAAEAGVIAAEAVPGSRVEEVFPFRFLITGPGTAGIRV